MDWLILGVAVAMALGILGTFLPLFPGLPLVWGAALVYGLARGFEGVGVVMFVLATVVFIVGKALGLILPHRRATAAGASSSSMLAGAALGLIGFFVVPVVGLPLGAAAGVFLAERRNAPDGATAWRTTRQLLIGFGLGVLAEVAAGVAIVAFWAAWVILR